MDITIHASALPHDDPDASLAFYRDVLGFEVRSDVGQGTMRWITVGPAGECPIRPSSWPRPRRSRGFTDEERRTIAEMMAKGTYGWILLATKNLDGTFEPLAGQRRRGRPGAWSSPTAFVTAPSAIPRATWSASRNCADPPGHVHRRVPRGADTTSLIHGVHGALDASTEPGQLQ